jgi:hypothetical protein
MFQRENTRAAKAGSRVKKRASKIFVEKMPQNAEKGLAQFGKA